MLDASDMLDNHATVRAMCRGRERRAGRRRARHADGVAPDTLDGVAPDTLDLDDEPPPCAHVGHMPTKRTRSARRTRRAAHVGHMLDASAALDDEPAATPTLLVFDASDGAAPDPLEAPDALT